MNGVRIEQKEGLSFDKPKFVKAGCRVIRRISTVLSRSLVLLFVTVIIVIIIINQNLEFML